MGRLMNVMTPLHKRAARDYLGRMRDDKPKCMTVAKLYDADYWDGDRRYGYGGYHYDGRWKPVAEQLIEEYGLNERSSILDVGCGKAYLLYELHKLLPTARLAGFDIAEYAIGESMTEIREKLFVHRAEDPYPYKDDEFDLVISLTTLHNLDIFDLKTALMEIERVGKNKYIVCESYRNDLDLFNLQCWALTCKSFFSSAAWQWIFEEFVYTGDYEFIYFE